eukprot:jgi/Galph1/4102/GphlegSOOS_G2729.1
MSVNSFHSSTQWSLPVDAIVTSPVFQAADLKWEDIPSDQWNMLAIFLAQQLQLDLNTKDAIARVHQLYLPTFYWILKVCEETKSKLGSSVAPVIGISCPQGGGKTTMTLSLQLLFRQLQWQCAVASIDDFYLTKEEQDSLYRREQNTLLQYRGNPGTHDIQLGVDVLCRLKWFQNKHPTISIPRYNKAAWNGLGDRFPVEQWHHVECPVDVILFEGWCLGFEPVDESQLVDARLQTVNQNLHEFYKWYGLLDGLVVMEIEDLDWIGGWRAQAEDMLRAENKGAMTPEQVREFVSRFMPAYQQYLFRFYQSNLLRNRRLQFRIDKHRRPIACSSKL